MKIEEVNNLPSRIFINNFKNIFEKNIHIAIICENKRPFKDKNHLINSFNEVFDNLSLNEKKKIIKDHPDLGNKIKVSDLTELSKNEQKNAGLDNCSDEEYSLFNEMNNKYKLKFNIPFIFAVKGANKLQIIKEFRRRLENNDIANELDESIRQVKKIAFYRLNEVIDD